MGIVEIMGNIKQNGNGVRINFNPRGEAGVPPKVEGLVVVVPPNKVAPIPRKKKPIQPLPQPGLIRRILVWITGKRTI
jgi:hypothetical protein